MKLLILLLAIWNIITFIMMGVDKVKAKKDKKFQKYIEKKRAKERDNRIQEMAEAIVRAKGMKKKK